MIDLEKGLLPDLSAPDLDETDGKSEMAGKGKLRSCQVFKNLNSDNVGFSFLQLQVGKKMLQSLKWTLKNPLWTTAPLQLPMSTPPQSLKWRRPCCLMQLLQSLTLRNKLNYTLYSDLTNLFCHSYTILQMDCNKAHFFGNTGSLVKMRLLEGDHDVE